MVTETKKPWEMNQKEYEQWYQENMGEKDNIPYSERVSQWKKQGKLTLILGKPTTLDKSADSSIMTSNKGEKDDDDRQNESGRLGTQATGERLRSGESHEGMAKDVTPGPSGQSGSESKGSAETGRESDSIGSTGLRGVVESAKAGDSGERQRLESKDIELNEHSDIGYNSGAASRFDANIAAIKTLKKIESEGRPATPDEQKILSKYSGFGDSAMGEAFPVSDRAKRWNYDDTPWGKRRAELKVITTPEEFKSIEGSRLNAFYTTPDVINAMWKALDNMGVKNLSNPRILEPSAGSGRFLGYEPKSDVSKSQRIAVELDSLTGRMLKQMYPQTETYVMGFERAPIPKDSIDVAISNVPFGNYPIFDPSFKKDRKRLTRSIHNYFFAKTLEDLRPGGVLAFITSHETMDAPSSKPIRQTLADQADLVGAIRLPKGAFPDTQVVTDIIFMRKRMPDEKPGDQTWVNSSPVDLHVDSHYNEGFDVKLNQNDYFTKHPEMIMGKPSGNGSMRPHQYNEGEYTVEPNDKIALSTQLNNAVAKIPHDIVVDAPRRELVRHVHTPAGATIHENTRVIGDDGNVYIKQNGTLVSANLTATEEAKVKAMLKIRDAAKKVVEIQVHDQPESELQAAHESLNIQYKEFVKTYGPLTANKNADLIDKDPDSPFLKALENSKILTKNKKDLTPEETRMVKVLNGALPVEDADLDAIQMPIFKKRIIHGLGDKPINSYADAESVVKNEVGSLDFDLMAEKLGKTRDDVIEHLAAQKLIYKDPMTGEWEPADRYLTGDVRTKLKQAEAAAEARPKEFKVNADDLKAVQPADIPAGEIAVRMGAPWIPAGDIDDFVVETLNTDKYEKQKRGYGHWNDPDVVKNYVQYNEITGEWTVAGKNDYGGNTTAMIETYGTERMPANRILEAILNGKLIEVKDKKTDQDGKEISVRNDTETVAAQEKAKLLQSKFQDWIWKDQDRTERLAKSYNDKFNNYRPRTFDGKHLDLPGISEKWNKWLMSHQKDAVWRVIQDRTALLAHEVGFGKTAVMVTSGMELRRMGLSRKNLYVVPKATHGQFRDDFIDIYPTAKILFPTEEDFTPDKRPEFMSRAITGDWDAIIMSDSQFAKLPIRPETEKRFTAEQIDELKEALSGTAKEDKTTQKQLENAIKKAEVRIETLNAKIADKADKTVYFEDLGVDQLYVDEADAYKNLKFATHMGRVKGLPNSESQRAWDMFTKTRTLQENKHNGVVFATGTPIANTIAEMYTMMRYLQSPMLEEKGLQHFDAWAKTFGETTESLEQTPQGTYKMTQRFSKFGNAPELSNIWQMTADVRVADEVPEMVAARPRIVDEQGKAKRIVIATPADQALLDYMQTLVERADKLKGKPEKGGDNMLKISGDARKASLDMRLVSPMAPVNPDGKVAVACKKITDIYKETGKDKGTQLVFLDIGTPKAKEKEPEFDKDGNIINEESDETVEEAALLKDVYKSIKQRLVANGVAEKDIAFIHDAKNQDQRRSLYAKVNSGEIRVLIGSTGKMGAGVNVQERAAALHHLDAPWRPRDIEQREGRVIRQGNKVYGPIRDENGKIIDPGKGVRIYSYVTERSFDAFMWQAIEAKSKAIKSIMRRSVPPRSIEDVDSFTLSASEAKAIASGNPDVFKQVSLKNAVARFAMLKASHTDQVVRSRTQLRQLPGQIKELNETIVKQEKDAKLVKPDAKFSMKVQGEDYSERPDAGAALLNAVKHAKNDEKVGEYQGFDVKVLDYAQSGYIIYLENPDTKSSYKPESYIAYADITAPGAIVRIENLAKRVIPNLDKTKQQLKESEKNLETYKGLADKPFEYEKQLDSAEKELERVSQRLQGKKVEGNESDNYVPPEEPDESEPEYHYSARGEEIKAEDEIKAVRAEVGNVEKETETKAQPAEEVVEVVEKMQQPEVTKAETKEETPGNPKLEDDFYVNIGTGHGFKPIKGKKVVIPGYEKLDFYVHHPVSVDKKGEVVEDKNQWGISEGRSGLYLGDDITSPQADWAIDRLKSKLARKMTPDKLEQSVENAIKSTGESPKYETETPIAKMRRQVHEIYNSKFSDFVSNELAHDETYQNALKHSDPQNIEVELQAAIKRAEGKEVLAKLAESQGTQPSAATKIEEPTHPFIGLYKGKQYESHAVSMYAAQKEIAKRVGARHEYDVSVYAATETEPLAAAVEHEKELPEETPFIEEGGPAKRKSKPSIETQAVAHVQQQIPEELPILEGNKVGRAAKPIIETTTKPKLAAFAEVAEKLEGAPVEMKGNKDLHDYAGMNPRAAHEVVEVEEMKQSESYHDAHLDALHAETTIKTPEQLEQKVAEIRGKKSDRPKITKPHDDGDLTVKDKKLMAKLRDTQDVRKKSEIWSNADLSREHGEQIVRNMVLSLPAGHYKLHDREYGTNIVDKIYDMYGWMPSLLVSESTMLGLQALHPEKVYASFTHGLDAIEIKQPEAPVKLSPSSPEAKKFLQPEKFPDRDAAMNKLGKPKVAEVHDDGGLTVKKGHDTFVVTTEGETFKKTESKRAGQAVSRGAHNAEKMGSTPTPATKETEPEREGHPISEAENRAIHAWYGEHGESNHGGKKRMSVLTTKQREALPDSAFAIPEERKYPIHDKNHAKAALARVAEFGTPAEKARVANAIKERYPEEETLNSYATAKAGGHKIMMTPLKDSAHHPVAPKGSKVSMSAAVPHITKPHMARKGRGLTRRSDR